MKKLSGGQKQRVAIIRSLILDPQIILADEPTTNLDSENFEFIMEIFKELKESRKIVIIATHDYRIHEIADVVYQVENYKLVKDV
ncbi:ATP-binding cassette domain-containing protein [Enterococcus alcedinis]|uniref:ATP-binding cassette domain-containing protein n=1 Tax=Enterococcus alcedinis TaxID=1274384 RepID=UPI0036184F1E